MMNKVSEGEIDAIGRPEVLFSHTDELKIPELADAETNLTKTSKKMAPRRRSEPSHPCRTQHWKTPQSTRLSLCHESKFRADMPLSKRTRETFRMSKYYQPTTLYLGSTRIGCTKIQESIWMAKSNRTVSGKIGRKPVCKLTQYYDVPSSKFGRIFFGILSVEIDRVPARKWKSERVIVFYSVILQRV